MKEQPMPGSWTLENLPAKFWRRALEAHLIPVNRLIEALPAVSDNSLQAEIILLVIPYLSEADFEVVLGLTKTLESPSALTRVLPALSVHFNPPKRQALLDQALEIMGNLGNIYESIWAAVEIFPYLPENVRPSFQEDLLRQAMGLKITNPWTESCPRAEALIHLLPVLSEEVRDQIALETLQTLDGFSQAPYERSPYRAKWLIQLIAVAPSAAREKVIRALLQIIPGIHQAAYPGEVDWRVSAFNIVSPYLHPESLSEALDTILAIPDQAVRGQILAGMLPFLPNEQRAQVFAQVLDLLGRLDGDRWVSVAAALLPYLEDETLRDHLLDQALDEINAQKEELLSYNALFHLAPRLQQSGVWSSRVLEAAAQIRNPAQRLRIQAAILPSLSQAAQIKLAGQILRESGITPSTLHRAEILSSLIPYLPDNLLAETLNCALDSSISI